jgi:disulfide bond formation protein DsbB
MHRRSARDLAVFAAIGAAAALAFAFALEHWAELPPCALCLVERWPYRAVVVLGLLAAVAPARMARVLLMVALLCLLADAGVAFVHVGVEFKWWPSPLPECAAPHFSGGSIADRLASMPARPAMPCDEPTLPIPGVPLSLAAMNMLFALAFSAVLAVLLARRRYRR